MPVSVSGVILVEYRVPKRQHEGPPACEGDPVLHRVACCAIRCARQILASLHETRRLQFIGYAGRVLVVILRQRDALALRKCGRTGRKHQ